MYLFWDGVIWSKLDVAQIVTQVIPFYHKWTDRKGGRKAAEGDDKSD